MKKILLLALALLIPFTYGYILDYFIILADYIFYDSSFYPEYFLIDAFACLVMSVIFYPIYKKVKTENVNAKKNKALSTKNLLKYTTIAFGMMMITNFWLNFASWWASNNQFIGESLQSFDETWGNLEENTYIWVFLSVVVFGPLVEEILFRGISYNLAERVKGGYFPVIFSSLVFAIWHGEPVQVVYTFLVGIAVSIVYKYTKSLKTVFFIHFINNLTSALPDFLNTDFVNDMIYSASQILFIPAIYILYKMVKEMNEIKKTEQQEINLQQNSQ